MVVIILRALGHGLDQRQVRIHLLHGFARRWQNGQRLAMYPHFHVHLRR